MSGSAFAAPARLRGLATPAIVAAALAALAAMLAWNVFQYEWLRAYDAWNGSQYVAALRDHGRLPTPEESGVFHTPPLFFAVAVQIESLAGRLGWPGEPQRAVQLLSAAATLVTVLLAFLTARELWPTRRSAWFATLGFAALMPVLVRAGAMYHPEPLATALTAFGIYLAVRFLARGRVDWAEGVVVGVVLSFAILTRTWALGVFVAVAAGFALRRPRAAIALVGVVALLTAPWFLHQQIDHGSALAFPREAPTETWLDRRPAEFFTTLAVDEVFTQPYEPQFLNRLWPTLYADWWGDYWRYYEVPEAMTHAPPRLPDEYHAPRVSQMWVGVLPSVLIAVGFAALARTAVKRRLLALGVPLAAAVLVFAHWLTFQQTYPAPDGDTLKAVYLLDAAVPLALSGGWALSALLQRSRLVFAAALLLLLGAAYYDVTFLVLPDSP